ncbi:MAG: ABC transporter ATP-binding protein [Ruminococcus sp.]|nr:ABC transporter ATP-binding protein [Ruminococcus sp.]
MQLKFENISKSYKSKKALSNITITLENGVHALLGPNGAGKTTLMNILTGLLKPSEGKILLDGENVFSMGKGFRNILGYLPQDPGFYPSFTGYEIMEYFAALKGIKNTKERIDELLHFVNLSDDCKRKYKEYSGGMKRRLGIAVSLLNDPKILVLDEPTAGLDPKERMRFRSIIGKIGSEKIIILATHIVSDVESIADKAILLKSGEIISFDTPSELINQIKGMVWTSEMSIKEADEYMLSHSNAVLVKNDNSVSLRIVSSTKPFENAKPCSPTLEDVYIYRFEQESSDGDSK